MDSPILISRRLHGADRAVLQATGDVVRCEATRFTARGQLVASLELPNERHVRRRLIAQALAELDAIEAIDEVINQVWPRCDGVTPSAAEDWHAEFTAADVVAWLEAGVPLVGAAADLDRLNIAPRDVARDWDDGLTLGHAFACGLLRLEEVQALTRRSV